MARRAARSAAVPRPDALRGEPITGTRLRRIAIVFLAVLAAPGTWLRTPVVDDSRPILTIAPVAAEVDRIGEFTVDGVWEIDSPNTHFGSYSGLLALADGRLLAASDRGRYLRFAPPGAPAHRPEFGAIGGGVEYRKNAVDVESLTADPARKTIWAGYEDSNTIVRFGPDLADGEEAAPRAMRGWSSNSGPESLARLPDGRFLVLEEGNPGGSGSSSGLLFVRDPVDGGEPMRFRYAPPAGYRPVDAAALPDGRVLVLHRRVTIGLPYGFEAKISVADPREIAAGEDWRGREIATLDSPLPVDNVEGIAVAPQGDGSFVVWLISDDNNAALQRTLLYRLVWKP